MKKTKLLTSIVAFALVLGLGACGGTDEDTTTGDESDSTSQTTEESGDSESEPTAYALVGDFVDADWDNEPAEDSKYYIAADATSYEVTVEMGSAPEDTDDWEKWGPWNAGLRVVEYGTWNLVAGYGQLDAASSGVLGEGSDNNIGVNWNATYDLTITLGENPSILVKLQSSEGDGSYDGDPVQDILEAVQTECNYTLLIEYDEYWSEAYDSQDDALANYTENHQELYAALYCTEDAVLILYYENDDDWEGLWDMEMYVNDYDEEETYYYEGDDEDDKELTINGSETLSGTWQDNFWWLADLAECTDSIVKGEGTSEIAYSFDFDDYDLVEALVGALYQCANYYPDWYSDGPDNLLDLLGDGEEVEYSSIYYTASETWTTKFHTGAQIYPSKSKYLAEDDTLIASVYNVGSTVISDEYTLIGY